MSMGNRQTSILILRGLCAERPEETDAAARNYAAIDVSTLGFTGSMGRFLEEIVDSLRFRGGPPTTEGIERWVERRGDGELAMLAREVGVQPFHRGAEFLRLVEMWREDRGAAALRTKLSEVAQILDEGIQPEKGKVIRGLDAALDHMIAGAVEVRRDLGDRQCVCASPEFSTILNDDLWRRKQEQSVICGGTGLARLDAVTYGGHPGELWFIGGYTGQGKSTLALNWARHLVLEGGWNVMIVSLEMSQVETMQILAASHAANPKWGRRPLLHSEIASGKFEHGEDEEFYRCEILPDFDRPDGGKFFIVQPRMGTRVSDVWTLAEAIHQTDPLDMIVIDYVALLLPEEGSERKPARDVLVENVRGAKRMALEFARGRGSSSPARIRSCATGTKRPGRTGAATRCAPSPSRPRSNGRRTSS